MAEVGGMSNLSQGISGPRFQPSYMLLLSTPHLVTVWPFGKKGEKTSCLEGKKFHALVSATTVYIYLLNNICNPT